ncbi:hypothetical protein HX807_22890 [Pseudomonas sp. D8002]|uniref:integrative conjugative element protein, RAQPRD family n=1 Tax=unclassified Pseudomonas TaxID=196821 RepID=UPI0015A4C1F5|nr:MULTISPECIES: RAQPRD family integrative conjugative element protein [unclassified Pseudomonas]NWA91463.1 hypothetical protein [Pseudomonas sp. D8002]NWB21036.1 hypothetical protein [Pseudomonas sp. D4002]
MTLSAYPLLFSCIVMLPTSAAEAHEQLDLSLVQRQIMVIQQLAERAHSSATDADSARYRFDYLRFAADLKRVRQGVHNYLSPSRAQPADLVELTGDYRAEAPHSGTSNEHD